MSSTDGDDSVPNFRRNLLVFCSLVLVGWFLGVPVSAIVQKIVGVDFDPITPWKLVLVQALAFFYFAHRYYTSPVGSKVFSTLLSEYRGLVDSQTYALANLVTKSREKSEKVWHAWLSKSEQEVVDEVNKVLEAEELDPVSVDAFYIEFHGADRVVNSRTRFNTRLNVWRSFNRIGNPVVTHCEISVPQNVYRSMCIRTFVRVSLMTESLTEHIVPLVITALTMALLTYRLYVSLSGYVSVSSCTLS
jgi:hypothetical protein